jgi:hypothetical protein
MRFRSETHETLTEPGKPQCRAPDVVLTVRRGCEAQARPTQGVYPASL